MVDPQRLRDELKRIRTLINERPDIKARFDKDGNGVIDGEEWEEVRQLVIKRLERSAAQAAVSAEAGEAIAAPAPLADGVVAELSKREIRGQGVSDDIGQQDELILRQEGGIVAQMMTSLARRSYVVYAASGRIIATIEQRENEAIQSLANPSLLESPEINFDVVEAKSAERLTITRRRGILDSQMGITDARGMLVGFAREKTALLRAKIELGTPAMPHPWTLTKPMLRAYTFELTDAFDEPKGEVQRQWSGLGSFLTGANQMHLELRPGNTDRGLRWALVTAMLLTDLREEQRS